MKWDVQTRSIENTSPQTSPTWTRSSENKSMYKDKISTFDLLLLDPHSAHPYPLDSHHPGPLPSQPPQPLVSHPPNPLTPSPLDPTHQPSLPSPPLDPYHLDPHYPPWIPTHEPTLPPPLTHPLPPWSLPPLGIVLCTVLVIIPWAGPPSLIKFHSA